MVEKVKAILEEIQVCVWHLDSLADLLKRYHTELIDTGILKYQEVKRSDPFISIADIIQENMGEVSDNLDLIEEYLNTGAIKQFMLIQGVTIEHQVRAILQDIQFNVWHVDSMAQLLNTLYYDLIESRELNTSKSVTSEPVLSIADIIQKKAKSILDNLDFIEEWLDAETVKQQSDSGAKSEATIN